MGYRSVLKDNLFDERVMLVTGGGSGIGRCTAHELAALGAVVVIAGRTPKKLESVCEEVREDGGRAFPVVCDIRDEGQVSDTVQKVLTDHGRIDGLVNNAGGQFPAPVESISLKGFETVLRTNLVGGFLLAREVFNRWMGRHGGAMVNITADHHGGMPGMAHSGAARAGMENFTRTAAVEWGHAGVRVNAVAPGWVASSGLDSYDDSMKPLIRGLQNAVPLGRLATEAEISAAICFLLSEGAAFITGTTLRVDGGASLGGRAWPLQPASRRKPFDGFHRAVEPEVLREDADSKA